MSKPKKESKHKKFPSDKPQDPNRQDKSLSNGSNPEKGKSKRRTNAPSVPVTPNMSELLPNYEDLWRGFLHFQNPKDNIEKSHLSRIFDLELHLYLLDHENLMFGDFTPKLPLMVRLDRELKAERRALKEYRASRV